MFYPFYVIMNVSNVSSSAMSNQFITWCWYFYVHIKSTCVLHTVLVTYLHIF